VIEPLQAFCRAEREWLLDTTEALVRVESPTTDKAAVDRCGHELAARITAIGGRVTRLPRQDRGDHLLAEFPSTALGTGGRGASQILLLGHFDTVWPIGQLDRMPLTRANGRLHGPGVFDMKAGIALGMLATRACSDEPARCSRGASSRCGRRIEEAGAGHRGRRSRRGAPQRRGARPRTVAAGRR
jgi:glutamate carboxypeptidase